MQLSLRLGSVKHKQVKERAGAHACSSSSSCTELGRVACGSARMREHNNSRSSLPTVCIATHTLALTCSQCTILRRPTAHVLPNIYMLPACLQYDITNLLAYILSELSTQLQGRLSLDPNSATHNVFTWLATADSLQLDSLRDACIDALGTYLLPGFASHAKHYTAAIARLPGPTAARVVCATARCARCVARVVEMDARSKVCAQYCPGRTQPMFAPVQMSPGQYVTLATGVCGMCSFTPSNPRYVVYKHHCPYCGLLREVAE